MKSNELLNFLRCPDDLAGLTYEEGYLQCVACRRHFKMLAHNIIELLPNRAYPLSSHLYNKVYHRLLERKFVWDPNAESFRPLERENAGYIGYAEQIIKIVREMLGNNLQGVFSDISGGSGTYSLPFSKDAHITFHLDLDVNSINYAYSKSQTARCKNVFFLRSDYLQLPFANKCLDAIICLGYTLSHGIDHEHRVISEILRCLKPNGKAVVDFLNFDRGLSKQASGYTLTGVHDLLSSFSNASYKIVDCGYVPEKLVPKKTLYKPLNAFCRKLFFPSSTWVVQIEKGQQYTTAVDFQKRAHKG